MSTGTAGVAPRRILSSKPPRLTIFDLLRRVAECLDRNEGTRRSNAQQLQAPPHPLAVEIAGDDDQVDIAAGMCNAPGPDPNRVMRSGRMRSRRSSAERWGRGVRPDVHRYLGGLSRTVRVDVVTSELIA